MFQCSMQGTVVLPHVPVFHAGHCSLTSCSSVPCRALLAATEWWSCTHDCRMHNVSMIWKYRHPFFLQRFFAQRLVQFHRRYCMSSLRSETGPVPQTILHEQSSLRNDGGSMDCTEHFHRLWASSTDCTEHLDTLWASSTDCTEHLDTLWASSTDCTEHLDTLWASSTDCTEHLDTLWASFRDCTEHLDTLWASFTDYTEQQSMA